MTEYKGYNIVWDALRMVTIHSIGKGALPKVLGGGFTTVAFAKNAIDSYLAEKGTKHGKTADNS